jgi:hypothetical protein
MASSSHRYTCRTAILSRVPNSTTNWTRSIGCSNTLPAYSIRKSPSSWQATTTWCPRTSISTRSNRSSKTRCCNPRPAPRTPGLSKWDGPTRSVSCIRTSRCSRSGAISATDGRATPDFGCTICCSARRSRHGSKPPVSTGMFADNRTPAIMHPLGSNSRPHQNQREDRDDGNWPGPTDTVVVDGSAGRQASSQEEPDMAS